MAFTGISLALENALQSILSEESEEKSLVGCHKTTGETHKPRSLSASQAILPAQKPN